MTAERTENRSNQRPVRIIDPGLGFGHPEFGLALQAQAERHDAELLFLNGSGGWLTRMAYLLTEFIYRQGSQGGLRERLYCGLRGNEKMNNHGLLSRVLTAPLVDLQRDFDGITVATHYLTGQAIGQGPLYVLAGDVYPLPGYANPAAESIFVPVQETVDYIMQHSQSRQESQRVDPDRVIPVGFVVHPYLLEKFKQRDLAACQERLARGPIHLALFLSGGRPGPHQDFYQEMLLSCRSILQSGLLRVTLVPMGDLGFGEKIERFARQRLNVPTGFSYDTDQDSYRGVWIVHPIRGGETRRLICDQARRVAACADVIFSFANERTPWPVPMVTFGEGWQIGQPAKVNHRYLDQRGLVQTLHHPSQAQEMILAMMKDGFWEMFQRRNDPANLPVDGAARIWAHLGQA